jgi:L,D-transpeptidase catalytic domain/Putative peptidoglycan binding domain
VLRPLRGYAIAAAVSGTMLASLLLGASTAHAEDIPAPPPAESPLASPVEPVPADAGLPVAEQPASDVPPPAQDPPSGSASQLPLRAGAVGWRVQRVHERLGWLGYRISEGNLANERMGDSTVAAVKKFQSKFGFRPTGVVGPGTYELLRAIAGRVGKLPKGCLGERTICIDKEQRLVRLVENDDVVLTLDARFGFIGAETREGTFRVHWKSRDHTSSLYRTWMPFALFFSGGQAVHYSPYFARDGYSGASHGCVNLRDYDRARWLFDRVQIGTPVHVYRS